MKDAVLRLSERVKTTMDKIFTEEATKTALVMPFLQSLGYDVFNPLEVVPEYIADVGIKKGEKVDYAICRDGMPMILIECKCCNCELSLDNEGQLLRYYHTSKAEFGILTNGIIYKFYTDLEEKNKMDTRPFLEINFLEVDKIKISELEKFCKANFDAANIRKTADNLKCASSVKTAIASELDAPSEDFVRIIFKKIDCGTVFNAKTKERLTPIVKASLDAVINDRVMANLSNALSATAKDAEDIATAHELPPEDGCTTTVAELDAYNIIRAISSEIIGVEHVAIKDAKTYCAILFDNNNRRPIARLYFNNPAKLQVGLFDEEAEYRVLLESVSDLFGLRERILKSVKKYIE